MVSHWLIQKYNLVEVNEIIEDRIVFLKEVGKATNENPDSLYLIGRKDETEALQSTIHKNYLMGSESC